MYRVQPSVECQIYLGAEGWAGRKGESLCPHPYGSRRLTPLRTVYGLAVYQEV